MIYQYQSDIDSLTNSFQKLGVWQVEDKKDELEIMEFILKGLPNDLKPSLQNVKPFDLERSIFIVRAWSALKDNNLIK